MRFVGVQLLVIGRALGGHDRGGNHVFRSERVEHAERDAAGSEVALVRRPEVFVGVRLDLAALDPSASLKRPVVPFGLLEDKACRTLRMGLRQKGFLAQRRKIEVDDLKSEGTVETANLFVDDIKAALVSLVLERRAGLVALEFGVLIVGMRELEFATLDPVSRIVPLAGEVEALLLHLDRNVLPPPFRSRF